MSNKKTKIGQVRNTIIKGDALEELKKLPDESIDMVVTSPPYYGLRDYDEEEQIGLEETFEEYLQRLLAVTKECQRVLKEKGTLWWVHGDSYGANYRGGGEDTASNLQKNNQGTVDFMGQENKIDKGSIPDKSLLLQPYRLAQRMVDEQGWILRNIIIWHKPSCMPSSVKDRFTVDYEPVLFFSKNKQYYFEQQFEKWKDERNNDIKRAKSDHQGYKGKNKNGQSAGGKGQPLGNPDIGRNKRTIWSINPDRFPEAHFAVYPEELIETPIRAGVPKEVCKKCGKPKELEIATERIRRDELPEDDPRYRPNQYSGAYEDINGRGDAGYAKRKKKGYEPTCDCDAGFKPGIVLDSFMGAGTTAVVARKLGRDYLGIELNPDYIEIAEERLAQKQLI